MWLYSTSMTRHYESEVSNRPRPAPSAEWFERAVMEGVISVAAPPGRGKVRVEFDSDGMVSVREMQAWLNERFAGGRARFGVQIACRFAVWFAYQVLVEGHRPGLGELEMELKHLPDRGPGRVETHPDRTEVPPHSRLYREGKMETPKQPRPHKPRVFPPRPAFELPHLRRDSSKSHPSKRSGAVDSPHGERNSDGRRSLHQERGEKAPEEGS